MALLRHNHNMDSIQYVQINTQTHCRKEALFADIFDADTSSTTVSPTATLLPTTTACSSLPARR